MKLRRVGLAEVESLQDTSIIMNETCTMVAVKRLGLWTITGKSGMYESATVYEVFRSHVYWIEEWTY